jgi:hypothetical protein
MKADMKADAKADVKDDAKVDAVTCINLRYSAILCANMRQRWRDVPGSGERNVGQNTAETVLNFFGGVPLRGIILVGCLFLIKGLLLDRGIQG